MCTKSGRALSLLRGVNTEASCGMDKFPVVSCNVGRRAIDSGLRRRLKVDMRGTSRYSNEEVIVFVDNVVV